jgi:hypothetical protein
MELFRLIVQGMDIIEEWLTPHALLDIAAIIFIITMCLTMTMPAAYHVLYAVVLHIVLMAYALAATMMLTLRHSVQ